MPTENHESADAAPISDAAAARLTPAHRESLRRVAEARERAPQIEDFHAKIEAARERLALAQANEPERIINALIAGEDGGSPTDAIEAEIKQLENGLRRAVEIRETLLEQERAITRSALEFTTDELEKFAALRAANDPEFRDLMTEGEKLFADPAPRLSETANIVCLHGPGLIIHGSRPGEVYQIRGLASPLPRGVWDAWLEKHRDSDLVRNAIVFEQPAAGR